MKDSDFKITNCFICLRPVEVEFGHFLLGDIMILAGTCEEHREVRVPYFLNRKGCFGAWYPAYGLKYDPD